MYTAQQTKIIYKSLEQRLDLLQEGERRNPHPERAQEIRDIQSLLKDMRKKPLKIEILECLDGKQRRFEHYADCIYFTHVKDGKAHGRTFLLNQEKLPPFIPKDMPV
jgi:hypothetical protein